MTIKEAISTKLGTFITIFHFDLKDSTGKHIHHDNFDGGYHLNAIIVSDDFKDKSLIERHRMVYSILDEMIKKEIHAISIEARTTQE